jgi:DHA1 family bicyclomycin/chloramphenicol resistance-like MFS transporter
MTPSQDPVMTERRVSWLGGLIGGLGPLSLALYTPAMPELAGVFATDDAAVKLTLSVYFAGFASAQLVCGPLSDRYGRKPVVFAFMLLYLVGSAGTLLSPTVEIFTVFRLLQGLGAAAGIVIGRAIVRDLYTGEASARVMNVTNVLLGAGPAVAPAIGGLAMLVAGWRAPLIIMLMLGVASLLAAHFWLRETRPEESGASSAIGVLKDYVAIMRHPYFRWSALTVGFAVATFYAQATVLSFIVMGEMGFSATQFGLLMLGVSGGYVVGALGLRFLAPVWGAYRLVGLGLACLLTSTFALATCLIVIPGSVSGIAVSIAAMLASNAFILPGMHTASLAPFPEKAGAASALTGFTTMGLGLLASLAISPFASPSLGLAVVNIAMACLAVASYLVWRRLGRH